MSNFMLFWGILAFTFIVIFSIAALLDFKKDISRKIRQIKKLNLQEGDQLLVEVPVSVSNEDLENIRNSLANHFKNTKVETVLVYKGELDFKVVNKKGGNYDKKG